MEERQRHNFRQKLMFTVPLVFLLVISYWRYTYILNPNLQGSPFVIPIQEITAPIAADSLTNVKSILLYWFLFMIANLWLFRSLFESIQKVKIVVVLFFFLSAVSGMLFAVHYLWLQENTVFNLASVLKNFLLGPLFSGVAYIVVGYLHMFRSP